MVCCSAPHSLAISVNYQDHCERCFDPNGRISAHIYYEGLYIKSMLEPMMLSIMQVTSAGNFQSEPIVVGPVMTCEDSSCCSMAMR